jgi:inorganic pyrophosphatase
MSVRPVGVLLMEDEAGSDEDHRGAVFEADAALRQGQKLQHLPDITLQQIQHFRTHGDLEKGKWVKVLRWGGAEEATS